MKKIVFLILVALVLAGCKKDNNQGNPNNNNNGGNNGGNNNPSGIVIKGKISGQKASSDSLSLADAKKVLVFSKYYYSLKDIVNDTFSVSGQLNSGIALIFLDSNNRYIGNLSAEGLNMLPLGDLVNGGNTVIDLSTLTLEGTSVIPSHDPLGNEIIISQNEINSLKAIGEYYGAIAQNIDADNDGVPDVLSDKQLVVFSMFARYSGKWGHNDTLPVPYDSAHCYMNYTVQIYGGKGLNFTGGNIVLSGPADDPYPDIVNWGTSINPGDNFGFLAGFDRVTAAPQDAPWGSSLLPFKKGTYTLTLDNTRNFNLVYSNIDAKYDLVIVAPTLNTNADGKLTSISLAYNLPDGTEINPASMLTNVMLQFSDNQMKQFYNSQKLTDSSGFSKIDLDTPMDISSLYQIDIWYDDLLGDTYDIIWR